MLMSGDVVDRNAAVDKIFRCSVLQTVDYQMSHYVWLVLSLILSCDWLWLCCPAAGDAYWTYCVSACCRFASSSVSKYNTLHCTVLLQGDAERLVELLMPFSDARHEPLESYQMQQVMSWFYHYHNKLVSRNTENIFSPVTFNIQT